ncbi:MAG: cell division protein FtsB [Gammaproteobacteria bacterium]
MKWIVIGLIALIMLQATLWVGQGGLFDFLHLKQAVNVQLHDNQALLSRNGALTADVADLKDGVEAIEERARNEMGMIKPGEIFYQVGNKHE